jgi:hypothetical protein
VAETEILFAYDARIDCPPGLVDMPSDRRRRFATAAMAALENVFTMAVDREATAVVLFGELLNPARISPAQAADVAAWIDSFCHEGGLVVAAADPTAAAELATALGEPPGLRLLAAGQRVTLSRGPLTVELACQDSRDIEITTHRLAAGGDTADDDDQSHASEPTFHVVERAIVHGQRDRLRPLPADAATGVRQWTLPSIQPRSLLEHGPGVAATLRLSSEGRINEWSLFPTAVISWQVVRTVCSVNEQEEELSATAAAQVEQAVAGCSTPLSIVRLLVDCEGDADRRGRVARIAPSVLGEIRQLLEGLPDDPGRPLAWCERVEADPAESLEPLAAADDLGGSRKFPAMLASEAASWTLATAGDERVDPAAVVREAAWMTLELLEDD